MSDEPDPPRLFMARMPMVFGSTMMTYAPVTLATSRAECWDKTLEWADGCYGNAVMFRQAYKQAAGTPAQIAHHLGQWGVYRCGATRTARIAWLRRRGCRVVAGVFTPTGSNPP